MADESNISETKFEDAGAGTGIRVDTSELQKNLVSEVSTVHDALRRKFRKCDQNSEISWEQEWNEHTHNRDVLEAYSKAMHQLATEVWDPKHHSPPEQAQNASPSSLNVKCRIEWVVLKCHEYFGQESKEKLLKLLDIGSCYNPFSKFQHLFDITALDLQPAPGFEKEVNRCDFLKLKVSEVDSQPVIQADREMLDLISLPEQHFDIVVFSFMLEYLPNPMQRLASCVKARSLLRPNGLMFILRPESNAVTATCAKWMKQWKVGLGYLGFRRVFLEKLEHFWGSAYSKLESEQVVKEFVNSKRFLKDVQKLLGDNVSMDMNELHKLFTIPQDFFKEQNEDEISLASRSSVVDADYEAVGGLFNELPLEL